MMAGNLDRRVEWQRSTTALDGLGGDVKTWSPLFSTWCCKIALQGLQLVQAMESVDESTVKIQFRWRSPAIAETDRFVFESRTYAIQSIVEIGRREGWEVVGKTRKDTTQVTG